MKLPIYALVDSLPQVRPYAPERGDDLSHDLSYDPVVVAVYRWLHGMEVALDRRTAPEPRDP